MSGEPKAPGNELALIQETIRTHPDEYWDSPDMQARHLALLHAEAGEQASVPVLSPREKELQEIRRVMRTDYDRYWQDKALQARHREIIEEELGEKQGNAARNAALRPVTEIRREVESKSNWAEFEISFDALPESVHRAVENDLLWGPIAMVKPVPQEQVDGFARTAAGRALVSEWGVDAPYRIARADERLGRVIDQLNDEDAVAAMRWINHIEPAEQVAILRHLSRAA